LPVFLAHVAPVASGVALNELSSRLSRFSERFEGTERGDDSAERESRLGFGATVLPMGKIIARPHASFQFSPPPFWPTAGELEKS
jgi:hypothetical protein